VVAYKANDLELVTKQQWQLVTSYEACYIAVRKVCANKGGKTPGTDNITWDTPQQR